MSDIWFSCGCREWRIDNHDEKGVLKQPEDTRKIHDCEKIIVYQDVRGLKRYFRNKR